MHFDCANHCFQAQEKKKKEADHSLLKQEVADRLLIIKGKLMRLSVMRDNLMILADKLSTVDKYTKVKFWLIPSLSSHSTCTHLSNAWCVMQYKVCDIDK